MNRRIIRKLHLWLSIPLGLFFSMMCLTGAPLVFKTEIRDALGMPHVVGPHTHGKSIGVNETRKKDFLSHIQNFHKSLTAGKTGKMIVTYCTIACTIILITGIAQSWPRDRRQWRMRLSIERGKGKGRLWYDLHTSIGYWTVIFLLTLCITGIMIGLHLYSDEDKWLRNLVLDLHTGRWGGLFSKIPTFIIAIIGATLPLSGYYHLIWRKTRNNHPES